MLIPRRLMFFRAGILILLAALAWPAVAEIRLVSTGATWKYLDDGSPLDDTWKSLAFDDAAWASGPAELGYGDGDEATVMDQAGLRPITIYLRHQFIIGSPTDHSNLTVRVLHDDGAIVYLNGVEVYRNRMPDGPVDHLKHASESVEGAAENMFLQMGSWRGFLTEGTNILCVELHQAANGMQDASFDMELVADYPFLSPVIQITSPETGSIFPNFAVPLTVDVSDLDGHIFRVDYYAGNTKLAEVLDPPFNFTWVGDLDGRFQVHALAIDNSGRRAVSQTILVQLGTVTKDELIRGPYLQMGTQTNAVVRWRTDWFTGSRVIYGTNPQSLDRVIDDFTPKVDHEVRLTGLLPGTRYYYSIYSSQDLLVSGPEYSFVTQHDTPQPIRVWVIGDSGTANDSARRVRDAYLNHSAGTRTDVWLMLGDNAYEEGTDEQYQAAVFDMYGSLLRSTFLWPTIGNHDIGVSADGRPPYLDIFTLPTQGEAGGMPSGTEHYYSFDFSNVHFVCLDSQISDRTPGGPMLTWLEADLASTDRDWIIAYWHHPPYSKGTHDSDRERTLIEMREYALPILEKHGVDVVLTGHSHTYERSYLLDGHYDYSTNMNSSHILDISLGRTTEVGPYRKPAGGVGSHRGTVYAVCGCSGEGSDRFGPFGPSLDHPAMVYAQKGWGSMYFDIDQLQMDAYFLTDFGDADDYFTIIKGEPEPIEEPRLTIELTEDEKPLLLSWPTALGEYLLLHRDPTLEGASWQLVTNETRRVGRHHFLNMDLLMPHRWFRLIRD